MKTFVIKASPQIDAESLWQACLEKPGIEPLYISETEELIELYLRADNIEEINNLYIIGEVLAIEPTDLFEVNWDEQWASDSDYYHEGRLYYNLQEIGFQPLPQWQTIRLIPGKGFGDLTHPTTHLVIALLDQQECQQTVVDIGCGSGILALCATALGAKQSYGIDIDQDAVVHSRENAIENDMQTQTQFFTVEEMPWQKIKPPVTFLMNMIISEQQVAWQNLLFHLKPSGTVITSGILAEQREAYLKFVQDWGFILLDEAEREGWLGFKFQIS